MSDQFATREEAFEEAEDQPLNAQTQRSIGNVIMQRFSRRNILLGALAVPVAQQLFNLPTAAAQTAPVHAATAANSFREIASGIDQTHHVADGHDVQILLRWGDALAADLPPFDPRALTADQQRRRFGYNNDYIAFFPLNAEGSRGLLCVNHEYTSPEVMFPGVGRPDRSDFKSMTAERVDIEMAAHGVSVIEIARTDLGWQPLQSSPLNRRITADTSMSVDGPAAGHSRMKTTSDPTGTSIRGTINNCGGGQTPWARI